MKTWLLTILLLSLGVTGWRWLTRVRDYNATQVRGQAAATRGQAAEAAYYLAQAVALAGRSGPAPPLLLDLAQAQAQAGEQAAARTTYARLLGPAVPAKVGSTARQQLAVLLARQGQVAQAIGLLRQALRLNPDNLAARYNYEVLSRYLAGQRPEAPDNPPLPPPGNAPPKPQPRPGSRPDSSAAGSSGKAPRPGSTGQPGASPTATRPQPAASGSPSPTPSRAGQPDRSQPSPASGNAANGGFGPGAGPERPLPSGRVGGRQRGLDLSGAAGTAAPAGRSPRPGTDAATDADLQLQTQRERLKAMNLTPAQAQQLLEELRASEQQYLQQRPRSRQGTAPAPGTPTW